MTDIKYRLVNPTGNITALVESEISVEKQPEAAEWIMWREPSCEQVGFISAGTEESDITLRMAGGEFCGNATMSAAVYYCEKSGLLIDESKTVLVKVIGTKEPVEVVVTRIGNNYTGTVKMPRALKISDELFSFEGHTYKYPVVAFAGISHIIAEDSMSIYMAERVVKLWCDKLKTQGLGLMMVNNEKTKVQPLVYVKNPETLVWESSCASGTTAVGAYFAKQEKKDVEYSFKEPGGILTIKATKEGDLYLSGTVEM